MKKCNLMFCSFLLLGSVSVSSAASQAAEQVPTYSLIEETYDQKHQAIHREYRDANQQTLHYYISVPDAIHKRAVNRKKNTLLEVKKELYSAFVIHQSSERLKELENQVLKGKASNTYQLAVSDEIKTKFENEQKEVLSYAKDRVSEYQAAAAERKESLYSSSTAEFYEYNQMNNMKAKKLAEAAEKKQAQSSKSGQTNEPPESHAVIKKIILSIAAYLLVTAFIVGGYFWFVQRKRR